ncbi:MAG TPA: 1-acyl-sn-glycerol-3-phosphate acyltransferase, partial [Gemmatimonadales bacterium]|nr:1-acyl-sn-glycerol-3-phosphate acyltransferase [Gemmatimonadales bacterium]
AAAGRPVRFLAKAPLFDDIKTGWLVKAAGAIPVYRRSDDPAQVERNDEMFRAVHQALAQDAAVAIFPEGISHSEPSIAPLKTGAARIALGAAVARGQAFPVIPVGLDFRDKERFRSDALAMIGAPVPWDDLTGQGIGDPEAVRQLTARIDAALRQVTVNLDAWHDAPLVDTAMRIWEAEHGATVSAEERVERRVMTAKLLAEVRERGDQQGLRLAAEVSYHGQRLKYLGLTPHHLSLDVGSVKALGWAAPRVPLLMPFALVVAVAGWLLFVIPYRLTGLLLDRFRMQPDIRSTWKLMIGGLLYLIWIVGLAITAAVTWHWWLGALLLVLVPVVGMAGLLVRERWSDSWRDLRSWLLLRTRRRLVGSLREEQRRLAVELENVRRSS